MENMMFNFNAPIRAAPYDESRVINVICNKKYRQNVIIIMFYLLNI